MAVPDRARRASLLQKFRGLARVTGGGRPCPVEHDAKIIGPGHVGLVEGGGGSLKWPDWSAAIPSGGPCSAVKKKIEFFNFYFKGDHCKIVSKFMYHHKD